MIACAYGSGAAAFVEPTVRDLARCAAARGASIVGVDVDRARSPARRPLGVSAVYVLPFEPAHGETPQDRLDAVFPSTPIANPVAPHELSCDRLRLSERLIGRGVPVPETLVSEEPEEVRAFLRQHEHVILRPVQARGSGAGLLAFCDAERTIVGEAHGRRYVVELTGRVDEPALSHGILSLPPPFFAQRMVTRVGRRGVLTPAPVLRAFVVDDHVPFWIESYRERVRRPSDFLLTAESGAQRRFVQVVSNEADKLARRAAEVVGLGIGAVDLVRSDTGYVALDVVTDGPHRMIDRSFKQLPEYREAFDLERYIAERIATDEPR